MNIAGEYVMTHPRELVWAALQNPELMGACTPGCQSIEVVEPDHFEMTVKIGIASISGTYKGFMALRNKVETVSYSMDVEGSGPIGTMNVSGDIQLRDKEDGVTSIVYTYDARIGGAVTGIAQRALIPIAKHLIKMFFGSVGKQIDKRNEVLLASAGNDAMTATNVVLALANSTSIRVPEFGNFLNATVIELAVRSGDLVEAQSLLMTLETEEGVIESRTPIAGVVENLNIRIGDKVTKDQLVLTIVSASVNDRGSGDPIHGSQTETLIPVAVPDIGDFLNIPVIDLCVEPGDKIKVDDTVVTPESDKATLDISSTVAGIVNGG